MEVRVDFVGIDATLKLVLIWLLFFHVGFCIESKFFIVKPHLDTYFFEYSFCESIAGIPFIIFSIAKGLAMCWLGGVISTQNVLF